MAILQNYPGPEDIKIEPKKQEKLVDTAKSVSKKTVRKIMAPVGTDN